jgi:pimeloyl-ACP methyl ester carboxylesterase
VAAVGPEYWGIHFRAIGAPDFAALRRAVAAGLPPTLLAWARDDHMLESEIPEELSRAIPGVRALAFPDGGHNIQKTRAAELGAAIREWLGAA